MIDLVKYQIDYESLVMDYDLYTEYMRKYWEGVLDEYQQRLLCMLFMIHLN